MKSCPACKTLYSDDTLQFCLQDGTPLAWMAERDVPTVVIPETETLVPRGGQQRMNIPVSDLSPPAWQPTQATNAATAMPEKKGSNTVLAVALTAFGMVILFAVIGIAAIAFMRNKQQMEVPATNVTPNANDWGTNNKVDPSPTPFPMSTPSRTPAPLEPPPLRLSRYPSTTRLKFGRGAYTTTFSGDINPGDSRSLVLGCRAGQALTATVSSGSGCAQLRGGGSSLRMTTGSGDNYLGVANNCSSVVHFSVRVSVF